MRIQKKGQPWSWGVEWAVLSVVLFAASPAQAAPICDGGEIIKRGNEIVGCRFPRWGSSEQSQCNGATYFAPKEGGTCHVCVLPELVPVVQDPFRWPELTVSGTPADFSCLGGYCAPLPAEARALYPLDETTGTTARDLIGLNPGTHVNGPIPVVGRAGMALRFDGLNDYVQAPSVAANNVGTGDFSVGAWVRTSQAGTIQMIVDKRIEGSYVQGYGFYLYNGGLGFQMADGVSWSSFGVPVALSDGQWHLVAVTVDRDDPNGGTFWVDGVAIGTFNPTGRTGSLDSAAPFRIGSRSSYVSGVFKGDIDEVELFSRALTASEIGRLYSAGSAGRCRSECTPPPANMVGWYTLDEWSGSAAGDLAAWNTGTRVNGPVPVMGKVGAGLRFDGSNDYVEAPSVAANNVGTGDFSIDAWVRTSQAGTIQMIVDKRIEGSYVQGYGFYLYNGGLGFQMADGVSYSSFGAPVALSDGQWHLVAVTVDRDNPNGGTFWVDGVVIGTFNPTGRTGSLDSAAPFRIGSRSSYVSGVFKGDIDEVELFNRVLTVDELGRIYRAGIAGKCK